MFYMAVSVRCPYLRNRILLSSRYEYRHLMKLCDPVLCWAMCVCVFYCVQSCISVFLPPTTYCFGVVADAKRTKLLQWTCENVFLYSEKHWGRNKILQTAFSNLICWKTTFVVWLKCRWNFLPTVSADDNSAFVWGNGASHDFHRYWPSSPTHICIAGLNMLNK